jgi:hypothetical protein
LDPSSKGARGKFDDPDAGRIRRDRHTE